MAPTVFFFGYEIRFQIQLKTAIRGRHVYKETLTPVLGDVLTPVLGDVLTPVLGDVLTPVLGEWKR